MLIDKKEIVLKNGQKILLQSATEKNAEAICHHRYITSSESYFMARYPEEISSDIERMKENLLAIKKDEKDFVVTAFLGEKIIGDAGVLKFRNLIKYQHRAYFGISILKEYSNCGLGTHILKFALEQAKKNGFEQIELGVFEDNLRAIHLYEKCGFKKVSIQPRAYKLKDNTYRNEILMMHIF